MNIFQIAALGIVAAILALMIKKESPGFAIMISLGAGILIVMTVLPMLGGVLDLLNGLAGHMGVGQQYVGLLVKIIGIAYGAEFGAQICVDAGEGAIASKIELAGKIMIMAVSAPVLITLLEQAISIFPV